MPRNLFCNVLGSSPNVQNLVSKIFANYCKRLVSKVSCLVSVSQRQYLVSVSKILAETPALFIWSSPIFGRKMKQKFPKSKGPKQCKSGPRNNMLVSRSNHLLYHFSVTISSTSLGFMRKNTFKTITIGEMLIEQIIEFEWRGLSLLAVHVLL